MADAKDFIQKIIDALDKLTTLEIATAVVPANTEFKSVGDDGKVLSQKEILAQSNNVMYSTINLIAGDITTRVPESFVGAGPFQELRAFHLEREKEGQKIIADNIAALKALIDLALHAESNSHK